LKQKMATKTLIDDSLPGAAGLVVHSGMARSLAHECNYQQNSGTIWLNAVG